MSDARFDRIESTLAAVVSDVAALKTDVAELKGDVAELKTDVAELKADVAELKGDVAELKTDVAELKADVAHLKTDVAGIKTEVSDLRVHMGVLHEDVIDRIRGLDEFDRFRQEMRAGFAEVMQALAAHAIPGEAADRQFAARLDDHETRIRRLERH